MAHALAKKGARKKLFENPIILEVPPMFASAHVWADILGTSFERKMNSYNR